MTIRDCLLKQMARSGYTQRKVADKTGLSGATISQYLKGVYNGNIDNVEATLRDFLDREEELARRRDIKVNFVRTALASLALDLIRGTHEYGDIGVIYGPAGMGKSMVLKEYVRANSANKGVILIEADPGYTANVLLQALCVRLGLRKTGNIHELVEECVQGLRDKAWLVLVDEAELLPHKALEVLRRIHDRSGVAIVLAGMPRLLLNLKGSRGEYAQLYSRVGMALDLEASKKRTETEDFSAILGSLLANGAEAGEGVPAEIAGAFLKHSRGNYRRLFKLARGGPFERYRQSRDFRGPDRPIRADVDSLKEQDTQSRHTHFPANSHFLAALSQVETVIHYLTIKGVTVYGVILRGCRPVIRIDYHKICEQRLLSGQAYYVTFGKSIPGGFKQGVFFTGGCRVIWSESLH